MRRLSRLAVYGGTVAAVAGLGKVHATRHVYDLTSSPRLVWSLAYVGLLCVATYSVGLPELTRSTRSAALAGLSATAAGAVGISLLQLVLGSTLLPRFTVLAAPALLVPWYVLCARLHAGARAREEERDRVVVVGAFDEVEHLRDELRHGAERGADVVAALSVEAATAVDPSTKPLHATVVAHRATVVVLDRRAQGDEAVVTQAAALHERGVRVRTLSLFYEEWLGKLPVTELERVALMFDIGEVHRARYGRMKRVLDLVVGVLGLVVMVVVIPLVLLGNLVANRGRLFFAQERVGRHHRSFRIVKFRTMRAGGAEGEWTAEDDPRITPFGRVLRRTHVDELPQVLNIIRGDLSIVGPRPEQPQYVKELVEKVPFYDLRHLVRPGLTGWAQVKYGYGGSDADAVEKLQYEFFYLRHQSLSLDIRILGRTLRSVVGLRGR